MKKSVQNLISPLYYYTLTGDTDTTLIIILENDLIECNHMCWCFRSEVMVLLLVTILFLGLF